jgi:hypothetical protein
MHTGMPVVHAGGRPLLDISATLKELVTYVLPSDTLFRVISFKEKTKQNSCRLLFANFLTLKLTPFRV